MRDPPITDRAPMIEASANTLKEVGQRPQSRLRSVVAAVTAAKAEAPISADPNVSEEREFVQVVRFGVTDDNQSKLIQVISDEVERWVRECPGFISCQMHASQDGKYVLNYARWQNESAFHNFTKHPETAALNAAIRSFGATTGPEPASYRLMRCILPRSSEVLTSPLITLATS
jgi:C-6 monooxygenase